MLLEVLLGSGGELDGGKLEAVGVKLDRWLLNRHSWDGCRDVPTVLKARDDGTNEAALIDISISY